MFITFRTTLDDESRHPLQPEADQPMADSEPAQWVAT